MSLFKAWQKQSMYMKLLLFITSLIVVTVLFISSVVYSISVNNSIRNAQTYNTAILSQQRDLLTQELGNIINTAVNLANAQSYLFERRDDYMTVGSLMDLSRLLEEQQKLNPFIESIYLYYDDVKVVLTSLITAKSTKIDAFQDTGWLSAFRESSASKTVWLTNRAYTIRPQVAGTTPGVITLLQKIPWIGDTKGAIVINVNQHKLFEHYLGHYHNKIGSMLVLDSDGQILYSEGEAAGTAPRSLLTSASNKSEDSYMDQEGRIITFTVSPLTGWKFINVTRQSELLQSMNRIAYVVLLVAGFYIVVALILAYLISKRLYRPLHRLVAYIKGTSTDTGKPIQNEARFLREQFDAIAMNVDRISQEKHQIEATFDQHKAALKEKYVQDLLNGTFKRPAASTTPKQTTDSYEDIMELQVANETYLLMTIELENLDAWMENSGIMALHLLAYRITDRIKEITGGEVFLKDADQIVLLLHPPAGGNESTAELARSIQAWILNQYAITSSIGISGLHSGMDSMERAYKESRSALAYKLYFGKGEVIPFTSPALQEKEYSPYYYPYELEKKLIQAVKQGQETEFADYLRTLTDEIFARTLSRSNIVQLYYQLCGELLKAIAQTGGDTATVLGEEMSDLQLLSRTVTLHDWEVVLHSLCRKTMQYFSDKRTRIHDDTLQTAVDFMQRQFNHHITVDHVAEHVQLSPSYLSRIFRENRGLTLNEYLIELRMQRALELLQTNEHSVEEICQMVGYANVSYFNKVFRSKTGLTPGHYRRSRLVRPAAPGTSE